MRNSSPVGLHLKCQQPFLQRTPHVLRTSLSGSPSLTRRLVMKNFSASFFSLEPDSSDAGRLAGESLRGQFGAERLKAVLVYATMNHDHAELLAGLRATLPRDVLLVGSSGQGVV